LRTNEPIFFVRNLHLSVGTSTLLTHDAAGHVAIFYRQIKKNDATKEM